MGCCQSSANQTHLVRDVRPEALRAGSQRQVAKRSVTVVPPPATGGGGADNWRAQSSPSTGRIDSTPTLNQCLQGTPGLDPHLANSSFSLHKPRPGADRPRPKGHPVILDRVVAQTGSESIDPDFRYVRNAASFDYRQQAA